MNVTFDPKDFYVCHPLDAPPEAKRDPSQLGVMPMTRTVRWALFCLRAYLILMILLVCYHVLCISGLFHHHR